MKQKVLTFIHSLNRGIYSSPSKISMRNSVLQAMLTHIHFSIIWRINYRLYNATVIGSNIHCDLIKQPGETVSAG